MTLKQLDEIQKEVMNTVTCRPYDKHMERDGNENYIHRMDATVSFLQIRRLLEAEEKLTICPSI